MEYWEIDIWKVKKFKFLNKEVEEFTSRWSQNLVNKRSTSYLKQRTFGYCYLGISRLYIQFFTRTWWCVVSLSYIYIYIYIYSYVIYIYIFICYMYIYIYIYIYIFHIFIMGLINNQQSLKTTLAFVVKLGAVVSF